MHGSPVDGGWRHGARSPALVPGVLVVGVLVVGVLAAGVTGCGRDDVSVGPGDEPGPALADAIGGNWTIRVWTADGADVPAPGEPTAFVTFGAEGSLAGDTGCNRFGGTWSVTGSSLSITPGATTSRACLDEPATAQEQAVLSLLPLVRSGVIEGDGLRLIGDDGTTLLRLAPGPAGLPGSAWRVAAVNNGREGLESSALTGSLTAEFDATSISGSGGCNTFSGPYATGGDGITIGPLQATEIGCAPEVAALEAQYLEALQRSTRVELEPGTLTLRDDTGAIQVTFSTRT